ncbi:MAG: hypothetical protein IJ439_01330 [Tyzzerella sp.]|nr:hypothetical protein [Tyzzerella sp.]
MILSNESILGIDIGTTNISVVVIDIEENTVIKTCTVANDSKLLTDSDLSECDAKVITDKARQIIDCFIEDCPNIKSIGITGQMHGVVYVDENGQLVSPLYTWQDGRSNRLFAQNKTYREEIYARTGYAVSPGYAFSTLFYNQINNLEPKRAKTFCTIMDYIAMNLTGNITPLIHPTNAASFGLYNLQKNCFESKAVEQLELSHLTMPRIAKEGEIVGFYHNIPVSVAIGDNQASFYGSVKDEKTSALVNFGTGSQISVVLDSVKKVDEDLEIRPYLFGKYLLCGSALCGGKAYAVLEKFFFKYAEAVMENPKSQYEVMNELALKYYSKERTLKVSTQFSGTREEPALRGTITQIDCENLTPENLILGTLQGMVEELKKYFDCMKLDRIRGLVASGNAVQKNKVLRMLLADTFHLNVDLTSNNEEAAIGAALYASVCNNVIEATQAKKIITYREDHKNELG